MADPIQGWIFGKILDTIYSRFRDVYFRYVKGEDPPEKRIKRIENRHKEEKERLLEHIDRKEERIEVVESRLEVKRKELTVKEQLMESLERKGVSREEIIRKYREEIPLIIINYTSQEPSGWLKEVLNEKYDSIGMSGGGQVIPPDKVPLDIIEGRKTLDDWLDEDIYENRDDRKAVIVYASFVDLRELEWRKDVESRTWTIGEKIPIEDYLTDEDFYRLNEVTDSIRHIEKGDIGFLASRYVTKEELEKIHATQPLIEKELGNPDIKEIADERVQEELAEALHGLVSDPEDVTEGVIREAKIWREEFF